METISEKRRGLIKNIAIVFLIVMLILTFFSNTIMNYSLPEVAAQYAYGGTITSSVRVTGTTEALDTYKVIATEGRTIQSVAVRKGDEVAVGDVLFVFEDAESTELSKAVDDLNAAKKEYELAKIDEESTVGDQELQVQYAKEDLESVKKKGVSNVNVDAAKKKVTALEKELASYSLAAAQLAYDAAKAARDKAQSASDYADTLLESANEKLQIATDALSALKESSSALDSITALERELETMQITLSRAQSDYATLVKTHDANVANRDKLTTALNRAKIDASSASGSLTATQDALAAAQAKKAYLESSGKTDTADYAQAVSDVSYYQQSLDALNQNIATANEALSKAQSAYDANESAIAEEEPDEDFIPEYRRPETADRL